MLPHLSTGSTEDINVPHLSTGSTEDINVPHLSTGSTDDINVTSLVDLRRDIFKDYRRCEVMS